MPPPSESKKEVQRAHTFPKGKRSWYKKAPAASERQAQRRAPPAQTAAVPGGQSCATGGQINTPGFLPKPFDLTGFLQNLEQIY